MNPNELIVVVYNEENKAQEVLKTIRQAEKERLLFLINAAVMVKNSKGKISIKETRDSDAKEGAIMGGITAGLIALLNPVTALGGIALTAGGAAVGALTTHFIDLGFPNEDLKLLAEKLEPESSAIIALVEHIWVEKLCNELEKFGGELLRHAIKLEMAAQIREAAQKVTEEQAQVAEEQEQVAEEQAQVAEEQAQNA